MLAWVDLSRVEHESLLNDAWGFSNWVDTQLGARRRQFHHALLFLLCLEEFELTMTMDHKKKIINGLREKTGTTLSVERLGLTGLDKAVA